MPLKLTDEEVEVMLADCENWIVDNGKLHQEYKFKNFVQAFAFMTASALEAEKLDHHPEWCNVYNKVNVHLVTHSASGITELDFALAEKMNVLARSLKG